MSDEIDEADVHFGDMFRTVMMKTGAIMFVRWHHVDSEGKRTWDGIVMGKPSTQEYGPRRSFRDQHAEKPLWMRVDE